MKSIIALTTILPLFIASHFDMKTPYDYDKAWQQVANYDSKQQPKSALKIVDEIYANAKSDGKGDQQIKALIYQLKYQEYEEASGFATALSRIKQEEQEASFPTRSILQSMIGQMYWNYYQNNRYQFLRRSETVNFEEGDVDTWSLARIIQESNRYYNASLTDAAKSYELDIEDFKLLLQGGNATGFRHRSTLYDFLAHRALGFYASAESSLTRPADQFQLDQEAYLSDGATFAQTALETADTSSMEFQALQVFQELTRLHLADKDPTALVALELQRLKFVRSNMALSNADTLYIQALENLLAQVKDHPASAQVAHSLAEVYKGSAAAYRPLISDAHKWDLRKAMEYCNAAISKFPDTNGGIACYNLKRNIETSTLKVTVEAHNLPAAPFRGLVAYRNLDKVYYRIVKTSSEAVQKLYEDLSKERNYSEREMGMVAHFAALSPVQSGSYDLENDGDYQEHSVEVKFDELPVGEYAVLVSATEDFVPDATGVAYAFMTVTDISYIDRNNTKMEATELYVLSRTTGKPLPNVTLKAYTTEYDYAKRTNKVRQVGTYRSDSEGYVRIPIADGRRRPNNISLDFQLGDDFVSTESIDAFGNRRGSIRQYANQGRAEERINVNFFLDRRIYRPGQTLYFKGLVTETDGENPRIMPGYTTKVSLFDVNFQQKAELELTTNEFGTFSGSFTVPNDGLTGEMQLRTTERYASYAHFKVEEYKRPKFYVDFNPVEKAFQLNDTIETSGKAMAYSGAAIDGAEVAYTVYRTARFPFWWYYRRGDDGSSPRTKLTSGTTTTDAQGKFQVDFKAIADPTVDPASEPVFHYEVTADVTDINGETHSTITIVKAGYTSLKVSARIGAIDKDTVSNQQSFPISTTNLMGTFVPVKGNIKIYQLEMPDHGFRSRYWQQPDRHLYSQADYYRYFPRDEYANESDRLQWKKGRIVLDQDFNTGNSKTFEVSNLRRWNSGVYLLEIESRDEKGQVVREQDYFEVMSGKAKQLVVPAVAWFPDGRVTAEPGETAYLHTGTSEAGVSLLYELEFDGQVAVKKWFNLKREKVKIPVLIREAYRGDVIAHLTFVRDNRKYYKKQVIRVPYSNKDLDISFASFRDKLKPGQEEQWKIIVKGKQAGQLSAEMVATLYDQSLDVFNANQFYGSFYSSRYSQLNWNSTNGFSVRTFKNVLNPDDSNPLKKLELPYYPELNWFGSSPGYLGRSRFQSKALMGGARAMPQAEQAMVTDMETMADEVSLEESVEVNAFRKSESSQVASVQNAEDLNPVAPPEPDVNLSTVDVRTNFNETAFFYPHLQTNEKGEIIVNFTIPEALTTWKMLGFAHTKDLQSASIVKELVTQKNLMVVPNQPRFFRENDRMTFSAKVTSLVDEALSGTASLEFFDALTMQPIDVQMQHVNKQKAFSLEPNQSTLVAWEIAIPEGIQAISYRIVAKAGNFSDGEEMTLPVVTNRMLVTESLPLPVRGQQTKTFQFDKLLNHQSATLRNHRYTLEFTANPAWYAVQALPYLMEYPYDCVEQTFSRYYANSIATHIVNSSPKIKRVFDTWKNIQPDALLSNLEKNQELKSLLLEETPWVLQAKSESQRKRNVGLLFDLNNMAAQQEKSLNQLKKAQQQRGGFSWFPGLPEDRYMTQYVITGMGHLHHLGIADVKDDRESWLLVTKAVAFLDALIKEDYDRLLRREKNGKIDLSKSHIGVIHYQYLYMRSFFMNELAMDKSVQKAFDYYLSQAAKYWTKSALSTQAMACLALHRYGKGTVTAEMMKSFDERAVNSEEFGKYWKNPGGYYWYQAPIETQALMIEVYLEVAGDQKSVEDLKVWLLKQKQTQDWKTTRATADACYALLLQGTDILATDASVDITIGNEVIDPAKREDTKVEAGTGYFKTAWTADQISKEMGNIKVAKNSDGVAWGAVYWQYFEQLDQITPAETPLQIKKQLFVEVETDRGKVIKPVNTSDAFKVGDLVKVRIELRTDRNMEYVHLKDMRAAAFEPIATLSGHRYQDGLYYYESPRDVATNFFIGYLPKGTYVFEYSLRASQKGNFSNGVTSVQCMYAPEFSSHSEGVRVTVE